MSVNNGTMNNSEKTLLIWVLIIAVALLALLYSPIGSPDIYHPRTYFTNNQGVDFSKKNIGQGTQQVESLKSNIESFKKITNSSKYVSDNVQNPEIKVLDENSVKREKRHYKTSSDNNSSSTSIRNSKIIDNKVKTNHQVSTTSSSSNFQNNENGNNSLKKIQRTNQSANSPNSINSSFGEQSSGNTGMNVNISASDLSSLFANNNSARQSSQSLDSGMQEPFGEPVPISDGWGYLILLTILYSIYIIKRNKIILPE